MSTFRTFVLELPLPDLPQLSFHTLLIMSTFWNHRVFHDNPSGRGLKLRKTEGRLSFGLTWPVQLNRPRHRLLPPDGEKARAVVRTTVVNSPSPTPITLFVPSIPSENLKKVLQGRARD